LSGESIEAFTNSLHSTDSVNGDGPSKKIRMPCPVLIIIDYDSGPIQNVVDACKSLRAQPDYNETRILVGGVSNPRFKGALRLAGANDVVDNRINLLYNGTKSFGLSLPAPISI
jgi:hypothetical protein